MFSTDPIFLQRIPHSEFRKRRAYYQLWKEANKVQADEEGGEGRSTSRRREIAPGVFIEEETMSDLPPGAKVIE